MHRERRERKAPLEVLAVKDRKGHKVLPERREPLERREPRAHKAHRDHKALRACRACRAPKAYKGRRDFRAPVTRQRLPHLLG